MAINASSQEIKVTSGNSWRARVHIPLEFLLEKE